MHFQDLHSTTSELNTTSALTGEKKETLACLIIDDPLLNPNYGCIDFSLLLEEMKEHSFFTEIAFIPWNYKRSNPKTVRLFAENPDRYAICVHGCNHTGNEFGKGDYNELVALSATALWRMEQHKKITGLEYDPVMVFPHGLFCSTAMKALCNVGYLAAFSSRINASDYIGAIEPEEYLKPATTIYHGFPLFLRHYPYEREKIIQDKEMGRPLIIVEHHTAFRNGYEEITEFIDWINSLGNIRWTSLLNIAEYYFGRKEKKGLKPANLVKEFNSSIAMRRFFSEVRDNFVETNNFLNNAYKLIRNVCNIST